MLAGAGIVDPETTFVEAGVVLEPDCVIHPFTVLRGATRGRRRRERRPARRAASTRDVGEGVRVGPFCYLRPGARAADGREGRARSSRSRARVIGERAKVPHLSYIGDAEIGEGTNIGAGNDHRQLRRPAEAPHDHRSAASTRAATMSSWLP